ncbi:hypothetical protein AUK18_00965 [Candidatus Beckwithbacteria bacterium CG2_30_44_31]|uniref:Uncharacterized protein n=1 Tax=Candidatus Beckwithbacteria bacterium CG2_30_44_31 TaxID=1805035 RepID=A0A1J5B7H6_9BACT|nr:MAG: hypothetical protein AUK18_00965 [Candidatus Beckwithbacteria bacterium CG2_30_44_31]
MKLEQLLGLQRITLFYLKRNAKVKRIQNHKVKVKRRAGVGAPANTIFSFFQVKLQVNGWVGFNSSSLHSPSRFMVFAERGRKAAE